MSNEIAIRHRPVSYAEYHEASVDGHRVATLTTKERELGGDGLRAPTINWSSWGTQDLDTAEAFANALLALVKIGKESQ